MNGQNKQAGRRIDATTMCYSWCEDNDVTFNDDIFCTPGLNATEAKSAPGSGRFSNPILRKTSAVAAGQNHRGGAHVANAVSGSCNAAVFSRKSIVFGDSGNHIRAVGVNQLSGDSSDRDAESEHSRCVAPDPQGMLLTASLTDYALLRVAEIPILNDTPAPFLPSVINSEPTICGDAGTVGAVATLVKPAGCAPQDRGVHRVDRPITSHKTKELLTHGSVAAE